MDSKASETPKMYPVSNYDIKTFHQSFHAENHGAHRRQVDRCGASSMPGEPRAKRLF